MIIIELTELEILDIYSVLSLPIVQKLWSKEQAERIKKLEIFFKELELSLIHI